MESKNIDLDIYGRKYRICKQQETWLVMIAGMDGKFRDADIIIPSSVPEHKIKVYLEDLLHEYEAFLRD